MEEIVAMGLMDLVKKAFLGASDEDNRKNRARVRDTFNRKGQRPDRNLSPGKLSKHTLCAILKTLQTRVYHAGYQ